MEVMAGQGSSDDNIASGGSSGAGSINIFCKKEYIESGSIMANGGKMNNGGAGGNGSISVGIIQNRIYESIYKNY